VQTFNCKSDDELKETLDWLSVIEPQNGILTSSHSESKILEIGLSRLKISRDGRILIAPQMVHLLVRSFHA
jgi:hypothetical protein